VTVSLALCQIQPLWDLYKSIANVWSTENSSAHTCEKRMERPRSKDKFPWLRKFLQQLQLSLDNAAEEATLVARQDTSDARTARCNNYSRLFLFAPWGWLLRRLIHWLQLWNIYLELFCHFLFHRTVVTSNGTPLLSYCAFHSHFPGWLTYFKLLCLSLSLSRMAHLF